MTDHHIHDNRTGTDWLVTPRPGEPLHLALARVQSEALARAMWALETNHPPVEQTPNIADPDDEC